MKVIVSGISVFNNEKIAYVRFEDNDAYAECIIPDCIIKECRGFDEEQCQQIIRYLKDNLTDLKKTAASINPIKAIMKN